MPVPLPTDEEDRLQELACYGVLDTPPDPALDRITSLAARVFRMPVALVSLVDRERQWYKANHGLPAAEGPRDQAFCSYAILQDEPFVVHDARLDERFCHLDYVVGPPFIRFYAGAPLITARGHRLGTLCLVDCQPREFSGEDNATLREFAALVMQELDRHRASVHNLAELGPHPPVEPPPRATRADLETRIAQRTTALVEAEARYRGIYENAVEGIYQALPGSQLLSVNAAFARLLGYESPGALRSAVPHLGLLYVDLERRVHLERQLVVSGTVANLESEVYRADGTRIWLSENARAVRDAQGGLLRYEGTIEDITSRRQAEAALLLSHEDLEDRVRERTTELALLNGDLLLQVAQREHAEAAAQRSEKKFRALVENAQDLISILTPDGVVVYSTPSVQHILGFTSDELLGKNLFEEYLHPHERVAGLAELRRTLETGTSYVRTECRMRHRDGSWRRLENVTSPLPPDFPLIGVVVNSRDVTERRQAERERRARSRQQNALAELGRLALQGIGLPEIFDHAVRLIGGALRVPLTSLNELLPGGERLLIRAGTGWGEGVVGHAVVPNWRHFQPSGSHDPDAPLLVEDLRQSACHPLLPDRFLVARPVSAVSVVMRHDGRLFGTLCALATERRTFTPQEITFLQTVADLLSTVIESRRHEAASLEVQARYQRIVAYTPGMVFQSVRHADGRISLPFVSEGCRQVCGLEPAQLYAEPNRLNDSIHPEDHPAATAALAASAANLSPFHWEGRLVHPNGDVHWVTVRSRPERMPNGDIYRDGVIVDVTELNQAREAMRAAKEEAERANAAKSEFLSRMSHELRTPLNAILGFGQLLALDDLPPNQQTSVDQILKGGRHLLELINEVLDISRIESGSMELSLGPVEGHAALASAADFVKPLARQHGIKLVHRLPAGPPFLARADGPRLNQVLLNLLSNGIKYNRPGGRLRLACRRPDPRTVRLLVADTGPGISEVDQARLFSPFERLDAANRGIEGTGIGLTISRSLVEAMGGKLGVHSVPGKGCTFYVDLPALDVPLFRAEVSEPTPPAPLVRTVLYVDDEVSNHHLLERLLDLRFDLRLLSASDARQGLAFARDHRPDLVLLDLHLPDLGGDEVVRRLRSEPRTRDLPVIILSGDATAAQSERLRALGVRDYVVKPFKSRILLAAIDSALATAAPGPTLALP